jgi:hypothetical protein
MYLYLEYANLKDRFAANQYAAAVDPALIPEVCDNKRPPNCKPDPEFALDLMVTNMWQTGMIWGEIY